MEPAVPGTEDVPLSFPTVSKQESEQERLLSLKAILPTGQYGNVFECTYTSGAEHWYCNMCECPIMGRVYHHEIGKRHTSNMSLGMDGGRGGSRQSQQQQQQQQQQQPSSIGPVQPEPPSVQVAPGEPVPPGFEGEVEKVCEIQERLDNYTVGPLIGLEYVFELQEYDPEKEPTYLCMLCDKKGDPRTVIAHLASYNHISQFLQKHFITVYRALSPYATKTYKRNWQTALQKIAEAIENRFGRLKPHPVEMETFEQNRMAYLERVIHGPHYSELKGCTFEELVDKNELTRSYEETTINKPPEDRTNYRNKNTTALRKRSPSPPVVAKPTKKSKTRNNSSSTRERRRSLSSVSSISSSDLSDFEAQKHTTSSSYRRRSISPRRSTGGRYRRSPSPRTSSRRRSRSRDRLPWQRSDYRRPRSDFVLDNRAKNKAKAEKMDEYKKLAAAIESDMAKQLKQHEKNPEKHAQYNDEWKQFWNRRYKELQAEGKDPNKHDFKPEWIVFWNKRMLELHNNEVKLNKEALRKRLGLPEEPAPICFKITGKKKPTESGNGGGGANNGGNKPKPMAANPDADPEVIVIDDKEDDTMSGGGGAAKRVHSPWEKEQGGGRRSSRSRSRSLRRERARERSRDRDRGRERSRDRDRGRETSRDRTRESSRDRARENSRERGRESRDRGRDSRDRGRDSRDRGRERSKERTRERSRGRSRDRYGRGASWDRDIKYYDSYRREREIPDAYKPPRVMRDVTRQPVLSPHRYPIAPEPEPEEEEGDINVVSVLRLLTALEEKLGSLGPKIIDLLAQALAMEKNEANSSETILDNEINCVVFETVKEKLKGQLLAGLVEYAQEKAYKNAIKKIASLIHYAGQRKKEREAMKAIKMDPVRVPGVGAVDKAAIAKQIATALILQGKTDVTQAELEQLINAVVGMAEASKNANKPITTASFVQQLQQRPQPAAAPAPATAPEPETKPMTHALHALQGESSTNSMEGLSDSDLQTLLQNFKDLSTTEQNDLITYLKKLESKEPERVERLRKFVTLGEVGKTVEQRKQESGRLSPFSNRLSDGNPMVEQKRKMQYEDFEVVEEKVVEKAAEKYSIDSDEDDYSFEDVFKAAKKNVKEKEEEKERLKEETKKSGDVDLKDAKAIIASLMSSVTVNKTSVATASNTINMDNLTNIVGNLKNLMEPSSAIPTTSMQSYPYVQYPTIHNHQPSAAYPNTPNYGYAPPPPQQHHQQQQQQQQQRPNVQYPLPTANNRMPMPYGGFNNQIRGPNPNYNPNNNPNPHYRW